MKASGKIWNLIGLLVSGTMILLAVPRIELGEGYSLAALFAIIWLSFALLVFAAHFHRLLGVDEAVNKRLAIVERVKRRQREQWLAQKVRGMK